MLALSRHSCAERSTPVPGTEVHDHVVDPADIGLPPLGGLAERWDDYYKGIFLPDGYPGKLVGGEPVAHPIYGVYVIRDYLKQAGRTGDRRYLDAAVRVARRAADRMHDHGDALVFWYEPDSGLSSWNTHRHYSALTQSYYASTLTEAGLTAGDTALVQAGRRVFASLLVPVADGGVLVRTSEGTAFEEVPTNPTSLVLNGWQSTLLSMWEYADLVDDEDVRDVVRGSARTMAGMLPRYDLPDLHNTRYSLNGFMYVRVLLDDPGCTVERAESEVPGASPLVIPVGRPGQSRWTPWLFPQDVDQDMGVVGRQVRLNVVLSRLSFPTPNVLHLTVRSPRLQRGRLQMHTGRYSPLANAPVDPEWRDVGAGRLVPGTNQVTLTLPWDAAELVGYPTNFMKKIQGRQTNVYHDLHVKRLTQLSAATGVSELGEWARMWRGYTRHWATSSTYREVQEVNARA